MNYKGLLDDGCNITGGSYKFAGLMMHEYESVTQKTLIGYATTGNPKTSNTSYFNILHLSRISFPMPQYDHEFWAGIDCSGLVQRSINGADKIGIPGASSTVKMLGDGGSFDQYTHGAVSSQDFVPEYSYPIAYDAQHEEQSVGKIRKGDLVRYKGHISIVYSDKPTCDETTGCTYEIIHASGDDKLCYSQLGQPDNCPFNRKVVVNSINANLKSKTLKKPTSFGRIKLWD